MQVTYITTLESVKAEHNEIVKFLKKKKFIDNVVEKKQWKSPKRKAAAIAILNTLYESTEVPMTSLSAEIEYASSNCRKIIDVINELLEKEYKIVPSIQIYPLSRTSEKIFCHFACDEDPDEEPNGTYSKKIISLVEAKKRGRLEKQEISQEVHKTEKLKYFRDMRDVLGWNTKTEAKWFRKGGPIAVDFEKHTVYQRQELLKKLKVLVSNNKISIIEGHGGTGKSVLLRNYAYNIIEENETQLIYYYKFDTDSQINDIYEFLDTLNSINATIIFEDIHLASTSDIQSIVNEVKLNSNSRLLFTARPSFREHQTKYYNEKLLKLPKLQIKSKRKKGQKKVLSKDVDRIIDNFTQQNIHASGWTNTVKNSIKKICGGDLWLLAYAIKGCNPITKPMSWIKEGVSEDLRYLEKLNCNPEILLALSPLYMNEVLTEHSFLTKELGFDRKDINKLVRLGEIIKHEIEGKNHYGLLHSSLALAYWEHGRDYRTLLKYYEEDTFILKYMDLQPDPMASLRRGTPPESFLRRITTIAQREKDLSKSKTNN